MNVRIVPRGFPNRTDLYGGIVEIRSDGYTLYLGAWVSVSDSVRPMVWVQLPIRGVAEILLDDDPGGGF